jgi:hypothetical protein
MPDALKKDLKTLVMFVDVYCRNQHGSAQREPVTLKSHDLSTLSRRPVVLCQDCRRLLTHALVKRTHCPMHPKPSCKHCPVHCYHPPYRKQMQEVMRFSGRHLLFRGRVDYLLHLLF